MYQSTHTGAQVDAAVDKALSADAVPTPGSTNLVQSGGVFGLVSNRNLLDNGWFTVNQRGVADATTVSGNNYFADRWQAVGNGVQRVAGGGITVLGTAYHKLGNLGIAGKTVTLSILYSDGEVSSNTFAWAGTQFSKTFKYGIVQIYPSANQINIGAQSVNVKAVKLELGAVSTLANDVAPNYADELEICKYYYSAPTDVTATNVKLVNAPIIKVKDGVCYIYIQATSPSETLGTNWVKLFTVPSSVRPPVQVGCNLAIYPYRTPLFARLTTGGDFEVYNDQASIATNSQLNGFLAYPLLDERS